jgi:hypothetical protein
MKLLTVEKNIFTNPEDMDTKNMNLPNFGKELRVSITDQMKILQSRIDNLLSLDDEASYKKQEAILEFLGSKLSTLKCKGKTDPNSDFIFCTSNIDKICNSLEIHSKLPFYKKSILDFIEQKTMELGKLSHYSEILKYISTLENLKLTTNKYSRYHPKIVLGLRIDAINELIYLAEIKIINIDHWSEESPKILTGSNNGIVTSAVIPEIVDNPEHKSNQKNTTKPTASFVKPMTINLDGMRVVEARPKTGISASIGWLRNKLSGYTPEIPLTRRSRRLQKEEARKKIFNLLGIGIFAGLLSTTSFTTYLALTDKSPQQVEVTNMYPDATGTILKPPPIVTKEQMEIESIVQANNSVQNANQPTKVSIARPKTTVSKLKTQPDQVIQLVDLTSLPKNKFFGGTETTRTPVLRHHINNTDVAKRLIAIKKQAQVDKFERAKAEEDIAKISMEQVKANNIPFGDIENITSPMPSEQIDAIYDGNNPQPLSANLKLVRGNFIIKK